MKFSLCFLLVLLVACKNDQKKQTTDKPKTETELPVKKTTYYLIRHAEKNLANPTDHDPHLTEEGLERAQVWAKFFSDKSLDMIYSTQYIRTIQTVIPTLAATKLKLTFYEPDSLYSQKFMKETEGKTVLIVGHQSSVPRLANKLLGEERYEKIPADIYDDLFTVEFEVDGSKNGKLERMDSQE